VNELAILAILLFVLIIAIFYVEYSSRKNITNAETNRKILHIVAGILAIFALELNVNKNVLIIVTASISILLFSLLFFFRNKSLITKIEISKRKSLGTQLFPVGLLFLLLVSDDENFLYAKISLFIMTFADAGAALIGENFEFKPFFISNDKKTISGTLSFFIFSNIIFFSSLFFFNEKLYSNFNFYYIMLAIFLISFLLTLIEAASFYGLDNLLLPIFSFLLAQTFLSFENWEDLERFYCGILYGGAVSYISYRLKFLKFKGAIGAFILAIFIFGVGGISWAAPILTFFIFSSLLSFIKKKYKGRIEKNYYEKGSERDFYQAMANGGVGLFLSVAYLYFKNESIYLTYILSLASACADTWATEFGSSIPTKVYHILSFKEIVQGTSGGVSFIGYIGALLGASIVYISATPFLINGTFYTFLIIIIFAIISTIIDSVIGAALQAGYKCEVCGIITEKESHCSKKTKLVKGFPIINNDMTNFISILIASSIYLFLLSNNKI